MAITQEDQMNILVKILLAICIIDFVVFPFYMVWMIRNSEWLFDLQQFHRVFHFVMLLFFMYIFFGLDSSDFFTRVILSFYIVACLQHNFKLRQLFTQTGSPFVVRYFNMLRIEFNVAVWMFSNLMHEEIIIGPTTFDVVWLSGGKEWGFVNYIGRYGIRIVCDALSIALILIFWTKFL